MSPSTTTLHSCIILCIKVTKSIKNLKKEHFVLLNTHTCCYNGKLQWKNGDSIECMPIQNEKGKQEVQRGAQLFQICPFSHSLDKTSSLFMNSYIF